MGHKHFLFNFFFSIKKSLGLTQNFLSYVIKIKGDVHAPSACAQHKKPVKKLQDLYQNVFIVDFLG